MYTRRLSRKLSLTRSETIKRGRTSQGMPIPAGATPELIAKLEARKAREAGRAYVVDDETSEEE